MRLHCDAASGWLAWPPSAPRTQARNPLDTSSEVTYKVRNYGSDAATVAAQKKVTSCEEGQRLQPDGFGGKRCVGEVKSVGQIAGDAAKDAVDNLVGGGGSSASDPMAGARMSQAAASKAASKPPIITKSTAPTKPLSMDELISNSIAQKEGVLGRPLNAEEQVEMAVKVKKLFAL